MPVVVGTALTTQRGRRVVDIVGDPMGSSQLPSGWRGGRVIISASPGPTVPRTASFGGNKASPEPEMTYPTPLLPRTFPFILLMATAVVPGGASAGGLLALLSEPDASVQSDALEGLIQARKLWRGALDPQRSAAWRRNATGCCWDLAARPCRVAPPSRLGRARSELAPGAFRENPITPRRTHRFRSAPPLLSPPPTPRHTTETLPALGCPGCSPADPLPPPSRPIFLVGRRRLLVPDQWPPGSRRGPPRGRFPARRHAGHSGAAGCAGLLPPWRVG